MRAAFSVDEKTVLFGIGGGGQDDVGAVRAAVAMAAMDSGVARKPIIDMEGYRAELSGRLSPVASRMYQIFETARSKQARVVFAEGEEERTIRTAALWRDQGLGSAILVGREDLVRERMKALGISPEGLEIANARDTDHRQRFTDLVYSRMQRRGALRRDCQRWINQDRNVFAAAILAAGDADAMVTGVTRSYANALLHVQRVLDARPGQRVFGMSILVSPKQTIFMADTTIHDRPSGEELADITVQAAAKVRDLGVEPRVALVSYSNFGSRGHEYTAELREAVRLLEARNVDFEFDGEMAADTALDAEALAHYPF